RQLLAPAPGPDPGGRAAAGRRGRAGAGAAREVRHRRGRPRSRRRAGPSGVVAGRGRGRSATTGSRKLLMSHRAVVIAGGLSHEREVSLPSGRRVLAALRAARAAAAPRDASLPPLASPAAE